MTTPPTSEATYSPRTHHPLSDRTSALLPPLYFAPAAAFFAAALVALPFLERDLLVYFYQARLLAVTHMITLGWLSMAMIGVLYRYVPALVKRALPAPRIALAQWATFLIGVVGLVVHFWLGLWPATAAAAAVLLVSSLLLCVNLWPLLWHAPRRGMTECGILCSTAFLIAAAALGTLLAVHKTYPFLGGGMLDNLAAHAHIAAVGWVGITVCALSFRFLPAFLLPAIDVNDNARRLVGVLAVLVAVLAAALLMRSPWAAPVGLALAAAILCYVVLVARVVASRQLPLDWTAWHAVASVSWCAGAAIAGGAIAALVGVQSELGARLAAAYGIAGLLGWVSNLLIGVSYKLFPAFVLAARNDLGRPRAPIGLLGVPARLRPVVFAVFNLGLVATVAALLTAFEPALCAGSALLAVAGLLYGGSTLRTMAFVVVDPKPSADPFAVIS